MPDALPGATLPLYPGLGEAPNMRVCIPNGVKDVTVVVKFVTAALSCCCCCCHVFMSCEPSAIEQKMVMIYAR